MGRTFQRIAVYCGSSNHADPRYYKVAHGLGGFLADQDIGVVFGGGSIGMMGALADGALAKGGEVIGVIPHALQDLELGHQGVTEMFVVDNMHIRKAKMAELADGFIALPGGFGTLEELFEVLTWGQLRFHDKPVALLNVRGFYDDLLRFLDRASVAGFLRHIHRKMLVVETDPSALLEGMSTVRLPELDEWIANP
jgi:uncharacterized protein (TIGR00730 family)